MRRALSAVIFFPRGGSAHSARGIAARLPARGWEVRLLAGSNPALGPEADARRFYRGLDLVAVEFDAEPGRGGLTAPMHPSYEDRPGAPDRVFAALDDAELEVHVAAWAEALAAASAASADVLHLHHLTPLNEAAARVAPGVPVVGQLHGTELLMLERIEAGNPDGWPYADAWRRRLREWAARCVRLIVAPGAVERAARLLGVELERFAPISNGFDEELFVPRRVNRERLWGELGIELPAGAVVLAYVGRFTAVKRVPLMIRAFARAQRRMRGPAALVLIGGYPDEWEGEHPAAVIEQTGARDVHLAGWHPHDDLPELLNASDAVVLASVSEQFGQALVEGMACGLPAIAARSYGPERIVEDGRSGWLVEPDDEQGLAAAFAAAVDDPAERRRRGEAARVAVRSRYSWSAVAAAVAGVFDEALEPGLSPR